MGDWSRQCGFSSLGDLDIPITNTPGMFGAEVADVALGYLLSLARYLHVIDRGVREGAWPKNRGTSLTGKTVGVIVMVILGKIQSGAVRPLVSNTIVYDRVEAVRTKNHSSVLGQVKYRIVTF